MPPTWCWRDRMGARHNFAEKHGRDEVRFADDASRMVRGEGVLKDVIDLGGEVSVPSCAVVDLHGVSRETCWPCGCKGHFAGLSHGRKTIIETSLSCSLLVARMAGLVLVIFLVLGEQGVSCIALLRAPQHITATLRRVRLLKTSRLWRSAETR